MDAGQIMSNLRLRSAQYWQRAIEASMVFPKPTASANITPFDKGILRQKVLLQSGGGVKSTAASKSERDIFSIPSS